MKKEEKHIEEVRKIENHIAIRKTIEVLVKEGCIDEDIVAWLLEEKYIKAIKKLLENK